ncbi:MAG: hypothetical protein ACKVUS_05165, partial [Saprospiraceae bacterium]
EREAMAETQVKGFSVVNNPKFEREYVALLFVTCIENDVSRNHTEKICKPFASKSRFFLQQYEIS